jgi:hypothetical protein
MVEHSLQRARERGFKAVQFNFVVSNLANCLIGAESVQWSANSLNLRKK